jgi:hypothetical protein
MSPDMKKTFLQSYRILHLRLSGIFFSFVQIVNWFRKIDANEIDKQKGILRLRQR